MSQKIKIIALVFIFMVVVSLAEVVSAQENTPQPDDSNTAEVFENDVFTRPRQTEEILRLKELYQDQVEKYTDLHRQFVISKAQFEKLNTLQSLEETVQKAREVMITRDDVLITYFELLRASLVDTEGIELTERKKNIDKIVGFIEALKQHKQALLKTTTREQIAERANEFADISLEFESVSYQSMALVTIGDIQAVYDKSKIIFDDVLQYHKDNPTTPLKEEERQRAYQEVNRTLTTTNAALVETRQTYSENQDLTRETYGSSIGVHINTSYAGTSQILFFLKELFLELT